MSHKKSTLGSANSVCPCFPKGTIPAKALILFARSAKLNGIALILSCASTTPRLVQGDTLKRRLKEGLHPAQSQFPGNPLL